MGEKPDPIKRPRQLRSAAPGNDAALDAGTSTADTEDAESGGITSDESEFAGTVDTIDATPQAIREEIEETRAQMSGTIDEIQERLSPRRLVNEAKETVRDATVGKVRDVVNNASESAGSIVERIKENPVPAALIGIAAYWLFGPQNSPRIARRTTDQSREYTSATSGEQAGAYLSPQALGKTQSGGIVEALKQHPISATLAGLGAAWWLMDRQRSTSYAGGLYAGESRNADDYSSSVGRGRWEEQGSSTLRDMAGDATETVADIAGRTQETVADYATRAQETVGEYKERAETEFDRLLVDNPLALGVVALAVGAAVGMAIPETRRERAMIGDVGHQLVDKAQSLAQGALDKVQQVASNDSNAGQKTS